MRLEAFAEMGLRPGAEVSLRLKTGSAVHGYYQKNESAIVFLRDGLQAHRSRDVCVDLEDVNSVTVIHA